MRKIAAGNTDLKVEEGATGQGSCMALPSWKEQGTGSPNHIRKMLALLNPDFSSVRFILDSETTKLPGNVFALLLVTRFVIICYIHQPHKFSTLIHDMI